MLCGLKSIVFDVARDIAFFRQALPEHPNSMKIHAYDNAELPICSSTYFSVGGGFVVRAGSNPEPSSRAAPIPHAFKSGVDLLAMTRSTGKSIAELVYENELSMRSADAIHDGLSRIWAAMRECVDRGCSAEGRLQGPLGVKRRAKSLFQKLKEDGGNAAAGPHAGMDWLNLFALAVNEENAGGGRVVTAPTNGAAGIIPAVLHYYVKFIPGADFEGVKAFLLTSAAIGALYKLNASISGAEVGCQGEVGVACSMAAAGFCAVLGGTPEQVENAAEIAMEHNLGLTCDPVGGRVQIPCIERNAMGAVKALNAAQMALHGNGTHYVSLDAVIRTMMQTGADMKTKYKETSKGGLAVNIIEC
jgi:L-serine dehydratase